MPVKRENKVHWLGLPERKLMKFGKFLEKNQLFGTSGTQKNVACSVCMTIEFGAFSKKSNLGQWKK